MVLSFDRWVGKVAIVTGASVGIGASIAEHLVKKGVVVAGLARRSEKIDELSKKLSNEKGKLHAVKADISKEEDILNAFKWVTNNLGPVHILINNAGIVQPNDLINGDTEKWRKVVDVNVIGLCIATREAVQIMQKNNIDGHIIHIGSVTGHKVLDLPGMNVYPASKHAVRALTETLRLDLNRVGSKIKITSVSPGYVETEIAKTNGMEVNEEFIKLAQTMPRLQSEDITDSVLYVLSTPPHVQVHELIIKPVNENF